jgi:hypothetical protein
MGYKCCLRKGTVRSLLGCSQTGGKILNTLHLPMPERGLGDFKFSTDSAAWTCTKGAANCSAEQVPPLADIRWGFAATAGALHWWRLASNGFGSYFDVKAGLQWCIVGRPGHGHEFESFSDVSTFLAGRYSEKEPNVKHWVLEAVILPPCTRL